jgi:hypothetical protein
MQQEEWLVQRAKWWGDGGRQSHWRTVRVFISSTFNDFHGERDVLTRVVFPQLNNICKSRRVRAAHPLTLHLLGCAGVPPDRVVLAFAPVPSCGGVLFSHVVALAARVRVRVLCAVCVVGGGACGQVRVVPVDLRWGLTSEDTSDTGLGALEHCLLEIDHSRPFFVYLSGERYGWIPPSYRVSFRPGGCFVCCAACGSGAGRRVAHALLTASACPAPHAVAQARGAVRMLQYTA